MTGVQTCALPISCRRPCGEHLRPVKTDILRGNSLHTASRSSNLPLHRISSSIIISHIPKKINSFSSQFKTNITKLDCIFLYTMHKNSMFSAFLSLGSRFSSSDRPREREKPLLFVCAKRRKWKLPRQGAHKRAVSSRTAQKAPPCHGQGSAPHSPAPHRRRSSLIFFCKSSIPSHFVHFFVI